MFKNFHLIKRILDISTVYNLYQYIIGCNKLLKKYSDIFIIPEAQKYTCRLNFLDLGCGTGNIIKYLPENINYTGIDYSENYINFDKNKFPQHKFFRKDAKESFIFQEKFDIIFSEALISNFNDEEVVNLFKSIINCANPDCKIIISDLNYSSDLSFFEKFLLKNERGNVMRGKTQYEELISGYFKIEKISEVKDLYIIPYKKIVFECRLK